MGVEVVHLLEGSTVLTYDVDRQTGYANQEGPGVTVDATQGGVIVPSADDHFLYMTGNNGSEYLWAYATAATGVPQVPPIQRLSLQNTYSALAIDPDGTLAYAVETSQNSNYETVASIHAFAINPNTGMVKESPKAVATFPPNGPCNIGAEAVGFLLVGFNEHGPHAVGDPVFQPPEQFLIRVQ
jgi:hypothetical protein